MKRSLVLFLLFLLPAVSLSAQEKKQSWLVRTAVNLFHSLTAPNKSLDSVYVFQPSLIWTATMESEVIRTGADLHSDITISDFTEHKRNITSGTLDRWSLCAETTYTRFGFQGVDTEISEENGSLRTGVKTRGTFYEWSIHVELNFRF